MKLIAHRGYTTKYIKENTLESFYNAKNNKFYGIELDTRMTKDGKPIVVHDASIDRVSDGYGMVSELDYRDLLKYNFGSKKVPSKVPLLIDILKTFKNMMIVIELKSEIDIHKIIKNITDATYFISFDVSLIKKIKKEYPKLKVGILNYVLNSIKDYNFEVVCILDSVASDNIVMHFLKQGIKVFIYGIVGKINYKRDFENLYYIVDKIY